jgi:glycosyltransferase involved in cell wall biosynthesis
VRAVVRACRASGIALDFVMQLANEGLSPQDWDELAGVATEPGTTVVHGALARQEYLHLLAESDVLLLPYGRLPYRQRGSGILAEAVAAGIPVVVPDGTWAAEQVEQGKAAGVVYAGDGPEPIAAALGRCAEEIEPLRARARACAAAWMRTCSIQAFLDWMEGEVSRRAADR